MDFISPQQRPPTDDSFASDPFYPEISSANFRLSNRVDGTVTDARLCHAIINAIIEVNRELMPFMTTKKAEGFTSLNTIPAMVVNNVSELEILYQRAVFSLTKANLTERYRDIDTTSSGEKKAEALSTTIDELWRDAQWAIQRIKGETHNIVELI